MSETKLEGLLIIEVISADSLYNADAGWVFSGTSDPYVIVSLDNTQLARTQTINNNLNPKWNTNFSVDVSNSGSYLNFDVWDEGLLMDTSLGFAKVKVSKIAKGHKIHKKKKLKHRPHHSSKIVSGTLEIRIKYVSNAKIHKRSWKLLEGESFPQTRYNKVTLYQDAHVGEDAPPNIEHDPKLIIKAKGKHYDIGKLKEKMKKRKNTVEPSTPGPSNAWVDIYSAIQEAKHFIYITGWSVCTTISLLRRVYNPEDEIGVQTTIGELLKQKAAQNVRVLLLLWNDKTSYSLFKESNAGVMGTHDEETKDFFDSTQAKCVLAYREGSIANEFEWTHHQKSVILDAPVTGSNKRQQIAFVGGLDLTDGRWDTPKHTLYRDLYHEHKNDFHNPWSEIPHELGPREPWHDIHSKLEGPVAVDVRMNFEERWMKQAPSEDHSRLFQITHENFIQYSDEKPTNYLRNGTWRVQLFRSIDQTSVPLPGVQKSIQLAYINAIRNSKRFLYIENQYFMGSCFAWERHQNVGSEHRIPYEIALKISNRIEKGKPYAVYVVVPMYPEGEPKSAPVQTMLVWQWETMSMMYKMVAQAIKAKGLDTHPQDYLNFYCLGNRETTQGSDAQTEQPNPESKNAVILSKSRRFMVYVHAKMLVADDEFVIVGSANINERSMAGNRDTEIAMGAYEEEWAHASQARGAVHQFRMNLWGEHLNTSLREFLVPEDVLTVRLVNKLAQANWDKYAADEIVEMETGHLMQYPILVDRDGVLSPKVECFPDTDAPIRGQVSELPFSMTA